MKKLLVLFCGLIVGGHIAAMPEAYNPSQFEIYEQSSRSGTFADFASELDLIITEARNTGVLCDLADAVFHNPFTRPVLVMLGYIDESDSYEIADSDYDQPVVTSKLVDLIGANHRDTNRLWFILWKLNEEGTVVTDIWSCF